jgi:pantoate--beta-alanine ligase
MIVARTLRALRAALGDGAAAGASTPRPRAFVPTMGALHDGHRRLFDVARADAATVVVSIFVNPRQFNDLDDLAAYPRPEADDTAMARQAGVDVLFIPGADEIYAPDDVTRVSVAGPAAGFEGAFRPGHFDGVATVCLKLFLLVRPDVAYFGQKDAQQVAVIRQLVRDLRLDLEIRVVPTVREPDGLAHSSRNARLSAGDRAQAAALPRALRAAVRAHRSGADPVAAARGELADLQVEYLDIAHFDGEATLVLAVHVGGTRLIDNVPLDDPARAGLAG